MAQHGLNRANWNAALLPARRARLAQPMEIEILADWISRARHLHLALGLVFALGDNRLAVAAIQPSPVRDAF